MRHGRRPALLALALLGAFALGRGSGGDPVTAPLDTPALREAARLERTLDALEAELHVGAARVNEQAELQRRHERVSALQCASASAQLEEGARLSRKAAERHQRLREARREAPLPKPAPSTEIIEEGGGEAQLVPDRSLHGERMAAMRTP
jgi:hypothetical protein